MMASGLPRAAKTCSSMFSMLRGFKKTSSATLTFTIVSTRCSRWTAYAPSGDHHDRFFSEKDRKTGRIEVPLFKHAASHFSYYQCVTHWNTPFSFSMPRSWLQTSSSSPVEHRRTALLLAGRSISRPRSLLRREPHSPRP